MSQKNPEPLVEINVDVKRLKGRRGILCGLLGAAVITTVLCLGLFAGKTNEINAASGGDACTLFANFQTASSASPSVCNYVIAGSSLVFIFLLVLLTETLLAVLIAFAYTDHLVVILLRGVAVLVSLIMMFCASIIISAGVGTTCSSWNQTPFSSIIKCADIPLPLNPKSSYLGVLVTSAIFGWMTTGLLVVIMVFVLVPLWSHVRKFF